MTTSHSTSAPPFGHVLRSKRIAKHFTLRKFAELVGISPTYLSQVENCNVIPPTTDRIQRIAELLGENADEWAARAGRLSDDVCQIISEEPTYTTQLLRTARGMTPEQFRQLLAAAERIKREK